MKTKTKVDSPLKWHGGKSYLAAKIVDLMPAHVHYVEPFAGGLSVLLAKDPEGVSEVANDLNGELANFWHVLCNETYFDDFQRRSQATPFTEQGWRIAKELHDGGNPVTRAHLFFILCRQSMAGRMKDFAPLSRTRVRRGMNEQASAWLTTIEGLPEVHARLKRVVILNRSALDVIKTQDGPDTLFYLDPPYLHSTRATTKEYGENEMSQQDHWELLEAISVIKGKFILSGYSSRLYEDFQKKMKWNRVDFELPNNAAGGKEKRRMIESFWMNY